MNINEIDSREKLFACKLIKNMFDALYMVDLASGACQEYNTASLTMLQTQNYEDWLILLAEKMYKRDIAGFFAQMELKQICASITEETPCYIVFYRNVENDTVQEYQLRISYLEDSQEQLVILRERLAAGYPKPLETIDELCHCNERFQFLVNRLIEDFIEIKVDTGECHMFHSDNGMEKRFTLKEQIAWWAEHLIIPEEREAYIKEYDLENLLLNLRNNHGFHNTTYTTLSSSVPKNLFINSTLIRETYGRAEEYIFAYCQDVTPLKEQETRNKQLVDISQQLLTLSQTEPVTNLLNRAACEKLVEEHLAAASGAPGTMLLIDIDHFKQFNDQYGHSTGDFVLKFLGKTIRDIFRSDDIVSRWGGDEFVVFMRDVWDRKIITGRIERLRVRLRQCKKEEHALPIMVSIGGKIATKGMTGKQLFDYCDKALYGVKSQGRNSFYID